MENRGPDSPSVGGGHGVVYVNIVYIIDIEYRDIENRKDDKMTFGSYGQISNNIILIHNIVKFGTIVF